VKRNDQEEIKPMSVTLEALERRLSTVERKVEDLDRAYPRRKIGRRLGVTIEEAQRWLEDPPEITEEDIQQALSIIGIAEGGPEDLSERCREYLHGLGEQK
jgi:hypothetical protein